MLVNAELADHDYEPKTQEFVCTLSKHLSHIEKVVTTPEKDYSSIMSIHILKDHETPEL